MRVKVTIKTKKKKKRVHAAVSIIIIIIINNVVPSPPIHIIQYSHTHIHPRLVEQ